MKLRFRVAAICLATVLTLGMLQPGLAYADGQTDTETETEQADDGLTVETSESGVIALTESEEAVDPDAEQVPDAEEPADSEEESELPLKETIDGAVEEKTASEESVDPDTVPDAAESEENTDSAELVAPEGEPVAASEELEDTLAGAADQDMMLMAVDVDEEDGSTLILTNQVDDAPEGTQHNFSYTVLVWDTDGSGYNRGLSGLYGDAYFFNVSFDATPLTSNFTLPAGRYGYASVTIPSNESIEITGLPDNYGYYILQNYNDSESSGTSNDTQYYLKKINITTGIENILYSSAYSTGTTGKNSVTFDFEYSPGYLRLSTEVFSSNPASANQEFEYTIYLYKTGADANTPFFDEDEKKVQITTDGSDNVAAPNLGDTLTFTKTSETLTGLGKTGVYNVAQVSLKNEQSVVLKNLGTGYGYYIVQTDNIHYKVYTYSTRVAYAGVGGSVSHTHNTVPSISHEDQYIYLDSVNDGCTVCSTIDFLNVQVSLDITKKVENSDTTRDFVFNVFFMEYNPDTGEIMPLAEGDYQLTYSTGETETVHIQQRSDITSTVFASYQYSAAQIYLKAGQTVTIEGLPMGVYYDIEEVPVADYTVSATAVNGTVDSDGCVYSSDFLSFEDASATFTNTFTPPEGIDLTLSKTVTGLGDQNKEFPFRITLTDADGNPLSNRDIMVRLSDGTETIYTTDENGVLTVNLMHGQTVTLEDLPEGTQYSVEETDADNYTTTFQVADSEATESKLLQGTLDDAESVAIQVNNEGIVTPTGVETENRPFALLFTGSAAALLALLIEKRRRKQRRR